jgi:hypothetical protein
MPTICVFFGIVVRMYYDEHIPPHFHAYYGKSAAVIEIETLRLRDGSLPKRAMALVLEWAQEHRSELMKNWQLGKDHQPLEKIAPLE